MGQVLLENTTTWLELEPNLDSFSLVELASKYQVSAGEIAAAIKRTGRLKKRLAAAGASDGTDLPPEPGEAQINVAVSGSKSHLVEAFRHLLGKVPDREIADKAGCSPRTVAAYRSRFGVEGYNRWQDKTRARTQKRRSRIDPFHELVGVMADAAVAKKASVSPQAVRNYRLKKGIPAPSKRARGLKKAPAKVATNAGGQTQSMRRGAPYKSGSTNFGWRLTFESGDVRIAIGPDLSSIIAQTGSDSPVGVQRLEAAIS